MPVENNGMGLSTSNMKLSVGADLVRERMAAAISLPSGPMK
jgi:hypothetical protein